MRSTYLNWNSGYGLETVDEIRREDFASLKEYRAEIRHCVREYHLAGMAVYTSSRACRNWKED